MRIHARTDLYVKALILMGLGALAVAGAVVDSRPDVSTLPDVPAPLAGAGTASVFTDVTVRGLAADAADGVALTLVPRGESRPAARAGVLLSADEPAVTARRIGPPRDTARPAVLPVATTRGMSDLAFSEVILSPMPQPDAAVSTAEPRAETAAATSGDDAGFFSGLVRMTSSSVGRTGASVSSSVGASVGRAGNSVAGAFRFVGDRVKRVF